jgi:hypothetical protein
MPKKISLALSVLIVLSMLLSLGAPPAQGATVTVTGTVVGRAGDLKSLAGITLQGPRRYISLTNSSGSFTIKRIIPGRYTLTVSQGNYVQRFNVNIRHNQRLNLRVRW